MECPPTTRTPRAPQRHPEHLEPAPVLWRAVSGERCRSCPLLRFAHPSAAEARRIDYIQLWLCRPDAAQTRLACGPAKACEQMSSPIRYGFQGQGHIAYISNPSDRLMKISIFTRGHFDVTGMKVPSQLRSTSIAIRGLLLPTRGARRPYRAPLLCANRAKEPHGRSFNRLQFGPAQALEEAQHSAGANYSPSGIRPDIPGYAAIHGLAPTGPAWGSR